MITVLLSKQSNYPVSALLLKKELSYFLQEQGVQSDAEVSIALVNEKTMLEVSQKYLHDDLLHDVLSFPRMEIQTEFIEPPDGILRLGEILVCYKMAYEAAKEGGVSIEQKVLELVKHGALHLLGIHHE